MENKQYSPNEVLPHAAPMVLISSIESYDLDKCSLASIVNVSKDDIFFDRNLDGVPPYVALEYMAQTIGCFAGILERQRGIAPKVGFIVGTRSMTTYVDRFCNNESYRISVKQLFLDDGLASFDCSVHRKETSQCCSKAIVNVYLPEDINNFVEGIAKGCN